MFLLAWLGGFAQAILPAVVLPNHEDPDAWIVPLQLAELEVADGHSLDGPHLIFEASGVRWTVRAEDGRGQERSVQVGAPRTPQDREDLAFLARGLLRELQRQGAPDTRPTPGMPPPPPPVAAVPAPRRRPAPPKVQPWELPTSERPNHYDQCERIDVDDAELQQWSLSRYRGPRRRARWAMRPWFVRTGTAVHPTHQPAFVFGLGLGMLSWNGGQADFAMSFVAHHNLELEFFRTLHSFDFDFTVSQRLVGPFTFGTGVGLSHRRFRQQLQAIDAHLMFVLSPHLDVHLFTTGRFAFLLEAHARVDAGSTELIRENGASEQLYPLQIQLLISTRFLGRGDLFSDLPTSNKR